MRDGPREFPQGSTCPMVLGCRPQGADSVFAYRTVTFYGGSFQDPSANAPVCNSPIPVRRDPVRSHDPGSATLARLTHDRFRLSPFRSPLLGGSRLLSFPGGTEMVHFPPFAPPFLCIQKGVAGHDSRRVSPFGHPRLKHAAAHRGLSQLATPFIAFQRQGIHRTPLVA